MGHDRTLLVRSGRPRPTTARAGSPPAGFDNEWSFVETLRHLVFATDAWASRTVLDNPLPYDRLGYTQSGHPPADAAAIGIDLDARPSLDEVMAVRADRLAVMRRIVDGLTDDELGRLCPRSPAIPTSHAQ